MNNYLHILGIVLCILATAVSSIAMIGFTFFYIGERMSDALNYRMSSKIIWLFSFSLLWFFVFCVFIGLQMFLFHQAVSFGFR